MVKMKKAKNKMIISSMISSLMMILMLIHMFVYEIPLYTLIVAILAFPVVFIIGYDVHKGSFKSLKILRPNMDVLVSLGSLPPYLIGLMGLFLPITTFIEMAATIMTFHLIGKYLESRAKGKASQAIKKLMELGVKTAHILIDGEEMNILSSELSIGDVMVIRPGEKIPTDGVIIEGKSMIDESLATGESMPVQRKEGDSVIGATINKQGRLLVKATKVGGDTFLSQMIELVEACQGSKVPIQAFADKITSYFVPAIMLLTILTFISYNVFPQFHLNILRSVEGVLPWIQTDQSSLSLAFVTATAVLVIACPCALGLGTPTALMVGSGVGAQNGILIKNGEAVQTLKDIDVIVFDKTGTLTYGKPMVTDMVADDKQWMLKIAASLEAGSEHVLASAIVGKAKEKHLSLKPIQNFEAVSGKGIIGFIDEKKYMIGNRQLMEDYGLEYRQLEAKMVSLENEAKTVMMVADDQQILGLIAVADQLKESVRRSIKLFESYDIKTVMLTGDNHRTARAIANQAGIDDVISGVLPEGKVSKIKDLQNEYGLVAMVGDGINDAGALKQANVGMAIGTGTDIAIEAADVTLVRGDITTIFEAIQLSKAIFKKIKENYFWAWLYNAIAIPFAVLGLLHPMIGAAAMSMSSLNVIYNSLRLKKIKLNEHKGEIYET
jgi:Cu+-exporting ATPase